MRILILGGTRFLGRALAECALSRGWDVTCLHRGVTGRPPDGVTVLHADRTRPGQLRAAVSHGLAAAGADSWDLVVDTWTGAPRVAAEAAAELAPRSSAYVMVSTISVYVEGQHVDETSPVVDGDPDAEDGDYPALKRGAELGVLRHAPEALLARCGLILGPYEDIGRLPWWLHRIAQGGAVVAPGRPDRPLQYVDVRDLAAYLLAAPWAGVSGPVDLASRSGHATMRTLLEACVRTAGPVDPEATLMWVPEERLAEVGAQPWTQLPCWVPETGPHAGFLESDTSRALGTGLDCRPVEETVADTWAWVRREGMPEQRPDRPVHGLPPELEQRLLSPEVPR